MRADAEGGVTGQAESEQVGVDAEPLLKVGHFSFGQVQFYGSAGKIPGEVLAADQIMAGMMIKGVGLEQLA